MTAMPFWAHVLLSAGGLFVLASAVLTAMGWGERRATRWADATDEPDGEL